MPLTVTVTKMIGGSATTTMYGCDSRESLDAWAEAMRRTGWDIEQDTDGSLYGERGKGEYVSATVEETEK